MQSEARQYWVDNNTRPQADKIPDMRIIIPKLKLDAIVVEEVNESDLDRGPMHMAGTTRAGQPGNCCIAAHKEKWFRGISKLAAGDKVILQEGKRNFTYVVTGQKIIGGNDIHELANTKSPTLTLITCTGRPFLGSSSGRLLVRARL